MNWTELISSPIFTAAVVTSSVAFISGLIQTSLSNSRKQKEEKVHYEKTLANKMMKVYSPLSMLLRIRKKEKFLMDNEIHQIIRQEGHLLSIDRLEEFQELIEIEYRLESLTDKEMYEYQFLREKLIPEFSREYAELHEAYNRSFQAYRRKYSLPFKDWLGFRVLKTIFWSTIVFWFFFISSSIFNSRNVMINNLIQDVVFIWGGVSIGATIIILLSVFIFFIQLTFAKKSISNLFTSKDYAPSTSVYKCTVCGKSVEYLKNQRLGECSNKHNFLQKLMGFQKNFQWKRQ